MSEAEQELCDLVVEELLEDEMVAEAVEDAISSVVVEITASERKKRDERKALEIAAKAEAQKVEAKKAAAIIDPGIMSKTTSFTCSAARYVDNVEKIRKELTALREKRDEIVNGIATLSQEMNSAKERVEAAQHDLREGERDLDRARLDVFLQLQHFGEDCVYIDADPRKPPRQLTLSSVAEEEEEGEEEDLHEVSSRVAEQLAQNLHSTIDSFLPIAAAKKVLEDVVSLRDQKLLRPGLVGGGRGDEEKQRREAMRGDLLAFYANSRLSYYQDARPRPPESFAMMDAAGNCVITSADAVTDCSAEGEGRAVVLREVERLVEHMDRVVGMAAQKIPELCNRRALLVRSKVMLTCYPGQGSAYVRHVDNPNSNGRILTAIFYLNDGYDPTADGGQIRLFVPNRHGASSNATAAAEGEAAVDVEPVLNRLLLFWSDKRVPHQVLPCNRQRYAVTVWYSDAEELHGLVR